MTYTTDELLHRLVEAQRAKGRALTAEDADKRRYGLPTLKAFQRCFGSWRNAINEACCIENANGPRSRADQRGNLA